VFDGFGINWACFDGFWIAGHGAINVGWSENPLKLGVVAGGLQFHTGVRIDPLH